MDVYSATYQADDVIIWSRDQMSTVRIDDVINLVLLEHFIVLNYLDRSWPCPRLSCSQRATLPFEENCRAKRATVLLPYMVSCKQEPFS